MARKYPISDLLPSQPVDLGPIQYTLPYQLQPTYPTYPVVDGIEVSANDNLYNKTMRLLRTPQTGALNNPVMNFGRGALEGATWFLPQTTQQGQRWADRAIGTMFGIPSAYDQNATDLKTAALAATNPELYRAVAQHMWNNKAETLGNMLGVNPLATMRSAEALGAREAQMYLNAPSQYVGQRAAQAAKLGLAAGAMAGGAPGVGMAEHIIPPMDRLVMFKGRKVTPFESRPIELALTAKTFPEFLDMLHSPTDMALGALGTAIRAEEVMQQRANPLGITGASVSAPTSVEGHRYRSVGQARDWMQGHPLLQAQFAGMEDTPLVYVPQDMRNYTAYVNSQQRNMPIFIPRGSDIVQTWLPQWERAATNPDPRQRALMRGRAQDEMARVLWGHESIHLRRFAKGRNNPPHDMFDYMERSLEGSAFGGEQNFNQIASIPMFGNVDSRYHPILASMPGSSTMDKLENFYTFVHGTPYKDLKWASTPGSKNWEERQQRQAAEFQSFKSGRTSVAVTTFDSRAGNPGDYRNKTPGEWIKLAEMYEREKDALMKRAEAVKARSATPIPSDIGFIQQNTTYGEYAKNIVKARNLHRMEQIARNNARQVQNGGRVGQRGFVGLYSSQPGNLPSASDKGELFPSSEDFRPSETPKLWEPTKYYEQIQSNGNVIRYLQEQVQQINETLRQREAQGLPAATKDDPLMQRWQQLTTDLGRLRLESELNTEIHRRLRGYIHQEMPAVGEITPAMLKQAAKEYLSGNQTFDVEGLTQNQTWRLTPQGTFEQLTKIPDDVKTERLKAWQQMNNRQLGLSSEPLPTQLPKGWVMPPGRMWPEQVGPIMEKGKSLLPKGFEGREIPYDPATDEQIQQVLDAPLNPETAGIPLSGLPYRDLNGALRAAVNLQNTFSNFDAPDFAQRMEKFTRANEAFLKLQNLRYLEGLSPNVRVIEYGGQTFVRRPNGDWVVTTPTPAGAETPKLKREMKTLIQGKPIPKGTHVNDDIPYRISSLLAGYSPEELANMMNVPDKAYIFEWGGPQHRIIYLPQKSWNRSGMQFWHDTPEMRAWLEYHNLPMQPMAKPPQQWWGKGPMWNESTLLFPDGKMKFYRGSELPFRRKDQIKDISIFDDKIHFNFKDGSTFITDVDWGIIDRLNKHGIPYNLGH